MTSSPPWGVFLNYRREDAAPYARLLQMELRERLPEAPVFLDLDSIQAGRDFADVIHDAVDSCAVLVALIGRQWATLTDEDGCRRLDNPDDYVRFEIHAALERGVPIIPVLVDGARPPGPQQLPPDLGKLARLNALELSYGRYQYDADRLFDRIQQVLAENSHAGTSPAEGTTAADHPERTAQKDSRPDQDSRPPQVRVFEKALAAAQSFDHGRPQRKSLALARLAGVVVATDPDRAEGLLGDAERIAHSMEFENSKAETLTGLAGMVAATDSGRAEQLAVAAVRALGSIPDSGTKRNYLIDLAGKLAAVDPDLAERAARSVLEEDEAELALARGLSTADYDGVRAGQRAREEGKEGALAKIAGTVARTDPDRAERIAESITTSMYYKGDALTGIAEAVVGFDPGRAERISELIVGNYANGDFMARIAGVIAAADPDRAERIAEQIPGWEKTRALMFITGTFASSAPDRAERVAQSITDHYMKAYSLARIAETVAGSDLERARRISEVIVENFVKEGPAMELAAGAMAAVDPDRAEQMAGQITDGHWRAQALTRIVRATAAADPDRAERIAESITYDVAKAEALASVLEAVSSAGRDA